MAWNASVTSCVKNLDGETVNLTFQITNGVTTKTNGPYKLSASDPTTLKLSIISLMKDAENFESRRDATATTATSFDTATVIGKTAATLQAEYDLAHPQPVPTQDQIDRRAFALLKNDYQIKQKALGISKTLVKADVDAALAAVVAAYKDSYGDLL